MMRDMFLEKWGEQVRDFIDDYGVSCDCCQHVMIDVTAALDPAKHQHCTAGDPEGDGVACAAGLYEDSGAGQLRSELAAVREEMQHTRVFRSLLRIIAKDLGIADEHGTENAVLVTRQIRAELARLRSIEEAARGIKGHQLLCDSERYAYSYETGEISVAPVGSCTCGFDALQKALGDK